MEVLVWLMVLAPFAGSLLLMLFGSSLPRKTAGAIGCASVGISFLIASSVLLKLLGNPTNSVISASYTWMRIGGFDVQMGLRVDALSAVMIMVVTFVGFLIHLYSAQSMLGEDGYSRFFAYMNLFVGSMLVLVLADNLLLLYLGWEGVGACSYLLIGFWYKEHKNGKAAQKAFIVTRVGDTFLAIGFFLIYLSLHTFDIQTILSSAPTVWSAGGAAVTAIAILIIGGAIGKSAQLPLQTWLPDAMAGPTPVSALIHAATMVTAGVYLIARLHPLFLMSPTAMTMVGIIGAATLLYAGFSALVQSDIKRVLAYSTISQIGYMFLALGVGAWSAAIFHLFTHAFFKALLFLSAGIVIDALGHEQNLFKMGGLKRSLPVAFWTFLIGSASLSALPFVTAGFYSKDAILYSAWISHHGGIWFWAAGAVGALITGAYSFRALFLAFFGEQKHEITGHLPGALVKLVVIVLAFFAVTAGFIGIPAALGGFEPFMEFASGVFHGEEHADIPLQVVLMAVSTLFGLSGLFLAWVYYRQPVLSKAVEKSAVGRGLHRFWLVGWGFDWLYDMLFVRPFKFIARVNAGDILDLIPTGLARLASAGNRLLALTQTGRVRNYAAGIVLGAVILTTILLLRHT